ncbi:hypothetical protein [Mumia sp. DW29H23]|uniref:hypothetical protein n=1 Tax=Mumia sp. DW29H23 TaxID=3421241 RepID=UPI003D687433
MSRTADSYRRSARITEIVGELDDVAIAYASGHTNNLGPVHQARTDAQRAVFDTAVAARNAARALREANDALTASLVERGRRV